MDVKDARRKGSKALATLAYFAAIALLTAALALMYARWQDRQRAFEAMVRRVAEAEAPVDIASRKRLAEAEEPEAAASDTATFHIEWYPVSEESAAETTRSVLPILDVPRDVLLADADRPE